MSTTVVVSFGSVGFSGAQIKAARLIEQINPLALELPISALELTLFSADGDFSVVNPSGFYASLQYGQALDVYEYFDAAFVYVGKFFLDSWESLSDNLAVFHAIDAIGLLDQQTCYGYVIPNGIQTSTELIDAIQIDTGVIISLDASLEGIWLSGWIPICTFREALQQICFALGAYATCTRSNVINIVPFELGAGLGAYDHVFDSGDKGLGHTLTLLPLVTGAQVISHYYTTDEINMQVFDGTLAAGTHRILFDGPKWADSPTLVNATNITAILAVNYIDINAPTTGNVTISVADYTDGAKPYGVQNNSLPVGTRPSVVTIEDATTVSHRPGVGIDPQGVVQRVYDYYQQRYLLKSRFFTQQIAPGESILTQEQGVWFGGIIERMETDLTGGFVSDVEIIGAIVSTCANILTANLTVPTGTDATYTDCLDMFGFNVDLQDSANLVIN